MAFLWLTHGGMILQVWRLVCFFGGSSSNLGMVSYYTTWYWYTYGILNLQEMLVFFWKPPDAQDELDFIFVACLVQIWEMFFCFVVEVDVLWVKHRWCDIAVYSILINYLQRLTVDSSSDINMFTILGNQSIIWNSSVQSTVKNRLSPARNGQTLSPLLVSPTCYGRDLLVWGGRKCDLVF